MAEEKNGGGWEGGGVVKVAYMGKKSTGGGGGYFQKYPMRQKLCEETKQSKFLEITLDYRILQTGDIH